MVVALNDEDKELFTRADGANCLLSVNQDTFLIRYFARYEFHVNECSGLLNYVKVLYRHNFNYNFNFPRLALDFPNIHVTHFTIRAHGRGHMTEPPSIFVGRFFVGRLPFLQDFPCP